MATESLGSAVLHLAVDATNFEAAIARSKNAAAGLGDAAEAAFQNADSKAKRASTSLIRWSELIGKSADEQKLLNAAMRGVPVEILAAVEGKMRAAKEEMAAAGRAAELLATKAQHAAEGLEFRQMQEGAQRVQRMQQAVSVFAVELERLEALERDQSAKQAFISGLQQQAQAVGKTRAELLELKAAELGVQQQAAPFIAKLKEQEAALFSTGKKFNEYGLSAKQTSAALRQVPAQITDIFVSLQGGQNPLTVLIQQGGQLRDVFGGIKPAAEALGGAIMKLVNPWTLLAAAIAGVIYSVDEAQDRQGKLANSLVLTGNAAGSTKEELAGMAKVLDDTTQASERHASAVVATVAATGRFTTEQVQQVAKAALEMEEATGRSIQQTVQDFASIGDDPVAAIKRLNNAIGDTTQVTNFLTAEQVKQIEQLQKQGDEAGAAKVAFDAYFNAINDRTPQVTEDLSAISQGWRNMKGNIGDATDAVTKFMAEAFSVKSLRDQFGFQDSLGGLAFLNQVDDGEKKHARPPPRGQTAPVDVVGLKAYEQIQQEIKANLSDQEKQQAEIVRIQNLGNAAIKAGLLSQEELNKAVADSNARFKEQQDRKNKHGGGEARSLENAQAKAALQDFKNILLQEQGAIDNSNSMLQAKYAARLITAEEYWSEARRLTTEGTAVQEKALLAEIQVLQQRDVQGKVSVDNLRQIGQLEAQLAKIRADGATKLAIQTIQEEDYYRRRTEAITGYRNSLNEANIALQQQVNEAIAAIGVGQQHAQRQAEITRVYDEQAKTLRELAQALEFQRIDQAQYDAQVQATRNFTEERVRILSEGYAAMDAMEADWRNGLASGLEDWLTNTSKVASQIRDITVRELDLATNALTDFANTGKIEIRSLLADMLKELTAFFMKRAVMMFLQAFLPSFGGGASASTGNFGIPMPGSGGGNFFLNAKGNPFPGGTSLPTNTIISKPTPFMFAKGAAFGVGGEAGAEAIMPLKRGPDGKLGVEAHGSGSPVAISVQTIVNNDGSAVSNIKSEGEQAALYGEFTQHMTRVAKQTVQDEMRPGGMLYAATHGGR